MNLRINVFVVYLILTSIFYSSKCYSQFNIKEYFPKKNGLVQSQVKDITQDGNGYLWIATYGGICRFDGDQFISYKTVNGLLSDEVNCVTEKEKGEIWVGTRKGINIIKDGNISEYIVEFIDSIPPFNEVSFIEFISNDQILIGTDYGKLILVKENKASILYKNITCILSDKNSLYIGSVEKGLFWIQEKDTILINEENGLPSNHITAISHYDDDKIIVGTTKGARILKNGKLVNNELQKRLLQFEKNINSISSSYDQVCISSTNADILIIDAINEILIKPEKLSIDFVNKVFKDREGVIWIGSEGKLTAIQTSPFTQYSYHKNKKEKIYSISSDKNGSIYYTSRFGIFVIENDTLREFSNVKGYVVVDNLFKDYYLNSNEGLLSFENNESIKVNIKTNDSIYDDILNSQVYYNNPYRGLLIDEENVKWFGFRNNLISVNENNELIRIYNNKDGLQSPGGVQTLYKDQLGILWIGCGNGLFKLFNNNIVKVDSTYNNSIYSIREDKSGNIWAASENGIAKVYIRNREIIDVKWLNENNGLSSSQFFTLEINDKDEVLACSAVGIDKISTTLNSQNKIQNLKHFDENDGFFGQECFANSSCKSVDGSIWFGTLNGVFKYDQDKDLRFAIPPKLQLNNIRLRYENQNLWVIKNGEFKNILKAKDPEFFHDQNHLTFDFVGISMVNHHKMRYSYYLEGFDDEWLNKTNQTSVTYPNILPGKYTFHLKVYNADGIQSEAISYSFTIAPPFWDTYWFYFIVIGFVIFIFILLVKTRERQLKLINIRLEKKVDKRTLQLKEEKIKVEKQHNEITKSINYAKRIQYSILPEEDLLTEFFNEHFVLYQPKDIVGGDFFWYRCFGDISVIATVDCTGHGVPGGFMSMMGSLLLDKIIQVDNLDTSKILQDLHNEITRVLNQKSGGDIQDGMDIAICIIDREKRKLHFSGARNGIIILSNEQLNYLDADLFSVGGSYSNKSKLLNRDFKTHSVDLKNNDWIFMYTDGYYDQLGGEDVNSMGAEYFKNALMDSLSAEVSKVEFLQNRFNTWKGEYPQIDDVLVIGFNL